MFPIPGKGKRMHRDIVELLPQAGDGVAVLVDVAAALGDER